MTGQEIIDKFHTYIDDQSELSTQEEIDLLNNIYQNVYRTRHWEWLKTVKAGTSFDGVDSVTGQAYITLPDDFLAFAENNNMTDNTYEVENNASPKVVYIIANNTYQPYQIVNFSDRRKYFNKDGVAWHDSINKRLVFVQTPKASTQYEFDYIAKPAPLTLSNSPIFDPDLHQILVHGMAIDHEIISLFDRAHSYAQENRAAYKGYLDQLAWENAEQLLN